MSDKNKEINVGGIVVKSDESSVVFSVSGGHQNLRLDAEHLPDLISFFSSLAKSPSEKRIGFRVPVTRMDPDTQHNLNMTIKFDGREWAVTPFDFSLTGVLVGSDETLADGTDLELLIEFQGKHSRMRAKVVRTVGDKKLALHFPSTLRDGELDPPDSLITIYRAIETIWLKQRLAFD